MQFMDVEIRSWTGRRPDYLQAFIMTALFYATVFPSGFLVLIVVLFNDRRRTLHDFLAGTLAVRLCRNKRRFSIITKASSSTRKIQSKFTLTCNWRQAYCNARRTLSHVLFHVSSSGSVTIR